MKASELFVKCLENEGIKYIFGIPGEENIDVMDALLSSKIKFILTRHEQGAAFMADLYARLTRKAGVCLSTLGPGATNLMTGVADAHLDMAPVIAIAGQAGTDRLHKESHQVLDLVEIFKPISKYATQILEPENIPEIVRKAFKVAQTEKPGVCFIDFPENLAGMDVSADNVPLKVQSAMTSLPPLEKIKQAAEVISKALNPIILAGNGVIRSHASENLIRFAEKLRIPVTNTFMAKGIIPFANPLSLGTIGLQAHDYVSCGIDKADVVICIGFDMIEYHPYLWHKRKDKKIIHIAEEPAEVDQYYILELGVIGKIGASLDGIAAEASPSKTDCSELRKIIVHEMEEYANDQGFPIKPQKIVWDLRQALNDDDIVISDVGAHKMWIARMYQANRPNTCIISNGFASMGIALPGAIGAKLAYPEKTVVAATGDAGFLMNCQEIETAMRIGTPIVVLIWNDSEYGLIKWKQEVHFGRDSNIDFTNPDFVKFAESFGAKGYRVNNANELLPTLKKAIADNTVVLIDCRVDYSENMKLTKKLGATVCTS